MRFFIYIHFVDDDDGRAMTMVKGDVEDAKDVEILQSRWWFASHGSFDDDEQCFDDDDVDGRAMTMVKFINSLPTEHCYSSAGLNNGSAQRISITTFLF